MPIKKFDATRLPTADLRLLIMGLYDMQYDQFVTAMYGNRADDHHPDDLYYAFSKYNENPLSYILCNMDDHQLARLLP